jgi:hypothetical protein
MQTISAILKEFPEVMSLARFLQLAAVDFLLKIFFLFLTHPFGI